MTITADRPVSAAPTVRPLPGTVPGPVVAAPRPVRAADTTRREAWRNWAIYALAVHAQLIALVLLRPDGPALVVATVLLGATLASALLSVVHDAGHSEFDRRGWVNNT